MADAVGFVPFAPGNIAATWWQARCSVIPIKTDGTKAPHVAWQAYQRDFPNAGQVRTWFEQQYPGSGVAVICGSISGNLEMLELEGRAYTQESLAQIRAQCEAAGIHDLWDRLTREGYSERTPSGGVHLLYRVIDNPVPGNTKIASRYATEDEYTDREREIRESRPGWRAVRVLAETRGEGGYVIVAPTSGACHPTGQPWVTMTGSPATILQLTWVDRDQLHACVRAALNEIRNEVAIPEAPRPPRPAAPDGVLSPGDDFDLRASWTDDWFTRQGWRIHHRTGNEIFWTRPGKDHEDGHSATTGYSADGIDRLYIWSTSTDLPAEQPLRKFFVYAHYEFGGDMGRCAKVLREQGYGTPLIRPLGELDLDFGGEGQEAAPREPPAPPQQHDLHSPDQLRPDGGIIFTDIGYARRMYDRYRDTFRYNAVEKRWYVWHPGASAWSPCDPAQVSMAAEALVDEALRVLDHQLHRGAGDDPHLLKRLEHLYRRALGATSTARINAIVTRFREQPGITVDADAFDNNLDLLNLGNCTYNLSTGTMSAHDPANMLTMTFAANYDPEAKCPRFEKFMEEVLPDSEVRAFVQRSLGYSLTGRPTKRALFMLHGPSGTGKSVLTSVITRLFGDYGTTAPATTFRMKKTETTVDVHQLRGKRFVATSEMPEGALLDEELVKRLTGGDMITSRALYESFHHWRAQCVIWIATNFLPRLSSDDNAIWRRAKTIPMRTQFGPDTGNREIEGLSDILLQERDGILNWLLDGLADYQEHGLGEPDGVRRDLETYRTEMDSVAAWFQDEVRDGAITVVREERAPTQLLYQRYSSHCSDEGIQPLGRKRFTKRLSTMAEGIEAIRSSGQSFTTGIRFASS